MNAERYYTHLLLGARQRHREMIRAAKPYRFFLREDCLREAREFRAAAHRYIGKIREVRNGH